MFFCFLWNCTPPQHEENNREQHLSSTRMLDIPQSSADWEMEEERSSYAGAGVLIEDIDKDGLLDIVLLRTNTIRLLFQREHTWEEQSLPYIEGIPSHGSLIDFDQDGDIDMLINTVESQDVLLRQDAGTWIIEELPSPEFSAGSTWYDINHDGLLDLSIAGYGNDQDPLFSVAFDVGIPINGNKSHFFIQTPDNQLVETELLPPLERTPFTFTLAWLPINTDSYWDLFSINDFGMLNGGHQVFWNESGESLSLASETLGLEQEMFGMGLAVADINHDQRPDMVITNIGSQATLLSEEGKWYDATASFGFGATETRQTCWGTDWGDVNNDGHLDLWVGCGPLPINESDDLYNPDHQPDALFLWTPKGYQDVATEWGIDRTSNTRAGGFIDINRDGCLDLIRVPLEGEAELFTGSCTENWVSILLDDGNAGIGTQIEVISESFHQTSWVTAGGSSFATYLPPAKHFGLGTDTTIMVKITWPNGNIQEVADLSINQYQTIVME